MAQFEIRRAGWESDRELLLAIRETVFIVEQQVPAEIEIDGFDETCHHVLATATQTGKPIGTARLMPDGRIGRVAVLEEWRNRGVGAALMRELMAWAAERGMAEVLLHAQTWTVGFYEKLGFVTEGEEFEEAGIAHRTMRLVRED